MDKQIFLALFFAIFFVIDSIWLYKSYKRIESEYTKELIVEAFGMGAIVVVFIGIMIGTAIS